MQTSDSWNRREALPIALVTVVSLALVLLHLLFPNVKVDSITVALVIVAAFPWVAPIMARYVKTVPVPGVGSIELRTELDELKGAAESAEHKAETALAGSAARSSSPVSTQDTGDATETGANAAVLPSPSDLLNQLADDYDKLRVAQKSGAIRTNAMTSIVAQMLNLSKQVPSYDAQGALQSSDAGQRLLAYAYLYVRPDASALKNLVNAVTQNEGTAFGQYWGLQAIEGALSEFGPGVIDPESATKLDTYGTGLKPSWDRFHELQKILRAIDAA